MKFREEVGATLPLLPGAMSPAGHMVIALPDEDSAAALAKALLACGFGSAELRRFSATAMSRWLKSLLPDAGRAADYGPLVPGLRDFYILALERCSWLVVQAPDDETVQIVAEEASRAGARSVTRYRLPVAAPLAATAPVVGAAPRSTVTRRDAGAEAIALR